MKTDEFLEKYQHVKTTGELAFTLYGERNNWKTWDGKPMPPWSEINKATQENWELSVSQAMAYYLLFFVNLAIVNADIETANVLHTFAKIFLNDTLRLTGAELLEDIKSLSTTPKSE